MNLFETINYYTQAINLEPNNAEFYTFRAMAYIETNTYDLAMNDCKRACNIDPSYGEGYHILSKCQMALG